MRKYLRSMTAVGLVALATMSQGAEVQDRQGKVAETLQEMQLRLGEEQSGLSNFTLNGFTAIDDSNLVVTSGTQDRYLITLVSPCLELPYALSIGFERRSTNINSFDNIIVDSPNRRAESCRISKIFRLDDAKTKTTE